MKKRHHSGPAHPSLLAWFSRIIGVSDVRARRRMVFGDEMVDGLCTWAAGMPWVIESSISAHRALLLFVVDCPDLGCHEPWFAVGVIEADPREPGTADSAAAGADTGIYAVLPDALALRGVSSGWVGGIEAVGRDRFLSSLPSPRTDEEYCALQRLLEVSYEKAFTGNV